MTYLQNRNRLTEKTNLWLPKGEALTDTHYYIKNKQQGPTV